MPPSQCPPKPGWWSPIMCGQTLNWPTVALYTRHALLTPLYPQASLLTEIFIHVRVGAQCVCLGTRGMELLPPGPPQLKTPPMSFIVAGVVWPIGTYRRQQPGWRPAPGLADYLPAWLAHRWWGAGEWRWSCWRWSRWRPRARPAPVCQYLPRPANLTPGPGAFRWWPELGKEKDPQITLRRYVASFWR